MIFSWAAWIKGCCRLTFTDRPVMLTCTAHATSLQRVLIAVTISANTLSKSVDQGPAVAADVYDL